MKKIIMLTIILLMILVILGCQRNTKPIVLEEEQTTVCVPIVDMEVILPIFTVYKDTDREIKLKLPVEVPIDLHTNFETDREVIQLAQKLNQDNIAINTLLYAAITLRNAAPCDPSNIKGSWDFMMGALETLTILYGGTRK